MAPVTPVLLYRSTKSAPYKPFTSIILVTQDDPLLQWPSQWAFSPTFQGLIDANFMFDSSRSVLAESVPGLASDASRDTSIATKFSLVRAN